MVDVVIFCEGTYPYVAGGVSSWIQAIISGMPDLTFGLVYLAPSRGFKRDWKFKLPPNVKDFVEVYIYDVTMTRQPTEGNRDEAWSAVRSFFTGIVDGHIVDFDKIFYHLCASKDKQRTLDMYDLAFSKQTWEIILDIYQRKAAGISFVDFFWTWRYSHFPLFQLLNAEIPEGRVYHTITTGWSGLLGVLAKMRYNRPLLLTETDGGLDMVIPDYRPRCQEPWAQAQEWALLHPIVHHEIIGDDWPIEPCVNVPWQISIGDFGVIPHATQPETDGTRGAYHIDAVLGDLEADFAKLHHRAFSVDRPTTLARVALLSQVYDSILTVRLRGNPWWTLGVTNTAVTLIGMEKLMLAMYDQPAALHRLLAFLCDDHLMLVDWLEREGLLTLNNEDDYIGSGSRGYTRALPHLSPPAPPSTSSGQALPSQGRGMGG